MKYFWCRSRTVNWLLGPTDIESCRASLLNSALNKATKAFKQNANPSSQANILKPPHQDQVFVWISSGNGSIFNSKLIHFIDSKIRFAQFRTTIVYQFLLHFRTKFTTYEIITFVVKAYFYRCILIDAGQNFQLFKQSVVPIRVANCCNLAQIQND